VALYRAGRADAARGAAERAATRADTAWGAYNLACYHALAGARDEALRRLRVAVDLGFADALIDADPDLATLRGEADYRTLAAAVRARRTNTSPP
jgi:hypothetical protein